jgi:RHS repeat-associated protein
MARTFTYDGENRQVTATIGSGTSSYAYDGNGLRVSKTANGQTTTYVYDAFGNLAAEYGGESSSTCVGTCYVTTDHLGSTRLLTTSTGTVGARYDYEPFGQEIGAGYDGRTTAMGFMTTPDGTNPKYTGQQRDQETATDWFQVRQMSGAQGRFQSPDPANAGADPSNPQSWNGYAYVANNPLSYTDPSGMFGEATAGGCLFGPEGCAIGAAVDIGIALAGIFDGIFGGGGPPPSIAPSLATPSSPILQPSPDFDSQGWNDQVPDDGSGSVNSGTLFGSGNTSPFVFSATGAGSGTGGSLMGQVVSGITALPEMFFVGFGNLIFNNNPKGLVQIGGSLALAVGPEAVANALAPATLYHFTSAEAAAAIRSSGRILPGKGLFGSGVYGSAFRSPLAAKIMGARSVQAVVPFAAGLGTKASMIGPIPYVGAYRVIAPVTLFGGVPPLP